MVAAPVVNLADLVDLPGQLEDALGRRGLSGVYVRENPDVSLHGEVVHSCLSVAGLVRGRRPEKSLAVGRQNAYRPRLCKPNYHFSMNLAVF